MCLGLFDLVEEFHNVFLATVGSEISSCDVGLDDLLRDLGVSSHKLLTHRLELFSFCLELYLDLAEAFLSLADLPCQVEPCINVRLLEVPEVVVRGLKSNLSNDIGLFSNGTWIFTVILHSFSH